MESSLPHVDKRRSRPGRVEQVPDQEPDPAAPRPITSIFSPLVRQLPTRVTAE